MINMPRSTDCIIHVTDALEFGNMGSWCLHVFSIYQGARFTPILFPITTVVTVTIGIIFITELKSIFLRV